MPVLLPILIFTALTRFLWLGSHPAGFNADEAALGYNAYSLLLTGRDEHGHFLPVNLESFADFKPALYSYLLIPLLFAGLPLSETVVRLPSAFFALLAVAAAYFLARQMLSPLSRSRLTYFPALCALFLALSPWHLHFSRGAWEVNVATTLILLGVLALCRYFRRLRLSLLLCAGALLVLSLYAYQSARLIAPLLTLSLTIMYRRRLHLRHLLAAGLFCLLLAAPLLSSLSQPGATARFSGVGFLSDLGPVNRVNELRGHHLPEITPLDKLQHNRPVAYALAFLGNYLSHFDPGFLFVSGDQIARSRVPDHGLLYLADFLFLALGFFYLFRFSSTLAFPALPLVWLLISPLAAAATFQVPHALRAHNMVVPLQLVSAVGCAYLFSLLRSWRRIVAHVFWFIFIPICLFQFFRFANLYLVHYPYQLPQAWQYGMRQVVEYVSSRAASYQRVIMTNQTDQPYILFLFYLRYPPSAFQFQHQLTPRDRFHFSTVESFANFRFASLSPETVSSHPNSLFIATPSELPADRFNVLKTVFYPDGSPAFNIIAN